MIDILFGKGGACLSRLNMAEYDWACLNMFEHVLARNVCLAMWFKRHKKARELCSSFRDRILLAVVRNLYSSKNTILKHIRKQINLGNLGKILSL